MSTWFGVTYFPTVTTTPDPSWSSNTDWINPCQYTKEMTNRHIITPRQVHKDIPSNLAKCLFANKHSFAVIMKSGSHLTEDITSKILQDAVIIFLRKWQIRNLQFHLHWRYVCLQEPVTSSWWSSFYKNWIKTLRVTAHTHHYFQHLLNNVVPPKLSILKLTKASHSHTIKFVKIALYASTSGMLLKLSHEKNLM